MIIVSQDKKDIIIFNNVKAISAQDNRIIAIGQFLITEEENGAYILGKYKTEERAKEILQEIVGLYRRCQQVIGERGGVANFIYPPKVYEMPKE